MDKDIAVIDGLSEEEISALLAEHGLADIAGSGGGGGGHTPVEAENTLRSSAVISVAEIVSEGPIVGPAGGAKGIKFNGTALQNADDSFNFQRVIWDWRAGTDDQEFMPGYVNASAEFNVNTAVIFGTPVIRTSSTADVDAIAVTILLQEGLWQQKDNGDVSGYYAEFTIERRLGAGTWEMAKEAFIIGKTMAPYERQYTIERPTGAGAWSIRVTRVTPDAPDSKTRNATKWSRYTEIDYLKLTYPGSAYLGLQVDAEAFGNQVPVRSYVIKGMIVKVPSNFEPEQVDGNRFTGIWDGTFVDAWTDDPAWVLYACMTNTRWGMGQYGITADDIDVYSFYAASVYNNAMVPVTVDGVLKYERRYTFNAVLNSDIDCIKLVQYVSGAMRSILTYSGGLFQLVQDSPKDVSLLITKDNTLSGSLSYASTGLFERRTEFNVTYNDRDDNYLQKTVTFPSPDDTSALADAARAAQDLYGFNRAELAAFGVTGPGQAMRFARWAFDSENRLTEIATWKASYDNFLLKVGMVIELYDEDYTQQAGAGRVISASGTTVVLDKAVPLTTGSKISLMMSDGTVQQRNISQTSGTLSTLTLTTAITGTVVAQAIYQVTAAVAPRKFKVVSITSEEANIVSVTAAEYDPGTYARVEDDIVVNPPLFSVANLNTVGPVTDVVLQGNISLELGQISRVLSISWVPPENGLVTGYEVHYQQSQGTWLKVLDISAPSTEIRNLAAGEVKVIVYAKASNKLSPGVAAAYTFVEPGGASLFYPVEDLKASIGGGLVFVEDDLVVSFVNPSGNAAVDAQILDFEVQVFDEEALLRTEYVPSVPPGDLQTFTYPFDSNLHDGGPYRNITVSVRIRDAAGGFSTAVTKTFRNPPPGIPLDINVQPGFESNKLTWSPPKDLDYEGVLVWASATAPFELGDKTLIYDGADTFVAHNTLTGGSTYFYRFAAYDSFAKDYTGASLNVSATYNSQPYSTDFDNNKLRNSSFEARQAANRPTYWQAYNNAGISVSYTTPAGRVGGTAYGLKANGTGATEFGLMTYPEETPDLNGVVGGWKQSTTYVISFYAKKVAGAGWGEMRLGWNVHPSVQTAVENPVLTVEYQRYVFKISWGGAIEGSGRLFLSVTGSTATNDQIIIEDIQVEQRDQATPYQPRIDEIVAVQAINVTGQLQDTQLAALSATKLTGTVTDAQIAGLAASKITGQLQNSQIQSLDSAKLIGAVSGAQLDLSGIDISTLGGKITSTQITDGSVSTPKLAAGAVVADKIAAGAVIAGKIAAGSIVTGDLSSGAVTTEKLSAGAVTTAKLAVGAVLADNIAAGAITTGKLLVTGQGKALNDDPSAVDASAWSVGQGAFAVQADSSVPIGTHSIRTTNGTQLLSRMFPVEANKTFKVSVYAKQVSGGGVIYVRLYCYDAAGALVSYLVTGLTPTTGPLEGLTVPGTWTRFNGSIKPNVGAVKAQIFLHTNWNTTGVTDLTDIRAEEYIGADLIVDGSINASKLVAGSVTTNQLAASSVTTTNLAAESVSAAKVQTGSLTATQIAAGSITGDRMVARTVTADKIAAGTITANSGVIADLAVTTLMVAGNAITIPEMADASGGVSPSNGSWSSILACPGLDVGADGKVVVTIHADITLGKCWDGSEGQTPTALRTWFRLLRGATVILEWAGWSGGNPQAQGATAYTFKDTPGAGTTVYTLQHQTRTGGFPDAFTTIQIPPVTGRRTMVALGVKK